MLPRFPRQSIVACPDCGLVFYDGPPPPADLYAASYFEGGEYRFYEEDKAILQRNFRRRVSELRRFSPEGRLFEIGCAHGYFLEVARKHWTVRGIDVSTDAVARARAGGLDAVAGEFLEMPEEPGRYDVICLWDTIEHLERPVETVEKAARWLAPGGTLALTTGDAGSTLARVQGEKWRQIHPPTHLFYFTRATLARVFEKAGLEKVRIRTIGHSRSYRSMIHGLFAFGRPEPSAAYRLLTAGGRLDFPVYLNVFDIVMATGRKPRSGGEPARRDVSGR
jgi:2-polyprenyl-3-methyl-5-hydroxy-6-metoxy-1,4-benzoquinol methylase